ncbi:MAG: hypothetical protein HKM04_11085 [Legionellales bacterium]|nr:hypothetical protein [Legionellales bacterium]
MQLKTTSLKLPKNLHYSLLQKVVEDGYGMRGKSRWILEAIEVFFNLSDYPTLVDLADSMDTLNDTLSIRLPIQTLQKIDEAVIFIRKDFPLMEGVKSKIIRASIMQRLLGRTVND